MHTPCISAPQPYIAIKEPYISVQQPYISPQYSTMSRQKSPISPPKSPISTQKSPVSLHKPCISALEPYILIKEPCISSNVILMSLKPLISQQPLSIRTSPISRNISWALLTYVYRFSRHFCVCSLSPTPPHTHSRALHLSK